MEKPGLYKQVSVRFLSSKCDDSFVGDVLVRPLEMVIDIPGSPSHDPYLIVGEWKDGYYEGKNIAKDGSSQVVASWACVGKYHAGIWIENGNEFFVFFAIQGAERRAIDSTQVSKTPATRFVSDVLERMKELDHKIAARKKREKMKEKKSPKKKSNMKKALNPATMSHMEKLSAELKRAVDRVPTPKRRVVKYVPKG